MMRTWWNGLAPRERRVLRLGGIALALILLWWGLWLPLTERVARSQQTVAELRADLAWMQAAARAVRAGRGQEETPPTDRGERSLLGRVDATAREAGLAGHLRRVQPDGEGTVRVWLDDAPFDAILQWLDPLQRRHGVRVGSLVVDRQAREGRVNARIVLEGPGA
ncbi:type II secretion system protein GspM [Ectothiorhodospira mobilis]|uniref:type II secretion system protein GspM n=1 Tax=Ectothiorhodospira mobilis TaxID=195064 RepID=UPI001EE86DA0|nr:type II secretion system protein M [Ectothiorhodospira mobilis]MCG5536827.1 type II secretion system protein M [Ectothiorhodospira mobilis]